MASKVPLSLIVLGNLCNRLSICFFLVLCLFKICFLIFDLFLFYFIHPVLMRSASCMYPLMSGRPQCEGSTTGQVTEFP